MPMTSQNPPALVGQPPALVDALRRSFVWSIDGMYGIGRGRAGVPQLDIPPRSTLRFDFPTLGLTVDDFVLGVNWVGTPSPGIAIAGFGIGGTPPSSFVLVWIANISDATARPGFLYLEAAILRTVKP